MTPYSQVDLVDSLPSNAHILGQTDEMQAKDTSTLHFSTFLLGMLDPENQGDVILRNFGAVILMTRRNISEDLNLQ